MEVYAKYTHKHTGRQCLGAQTPMAAGPGLGKGATVLLKWAAAFWFQPVVLQDVDPSPDGSSHFSEEIEIQAVTKVSRAHSAVGRGPPGSRGQGEEGWEAERPASRAPAAPSRLAPLCTWAWKTASCRGG